MFHSTELSVGIPYPEPAELVGATIDDRWYLRKLIAAGGMGTVYEAQHVHNGRLAAIKILHPSLRDIPIICSRFQEEAYAANRVRHPGVVAALDDGRLADGTPFLVLELLRGKTVEDLWERSGRVFSEIKALTLAVKVLDILASAHRNGVIHRDIKPENVFITRKGNVKLLDFGIAKVNGRQLEHRTDYRSTMGTPSFMPPEQARGRWDEVDPRSDLWSLSAVLFTITTGQFVHHSETANETLLAAMCNPAPRVRDVAPTVSKAVANVIDRGLSYDKRDRYQSAEEMDEDVRRALRLVRSPSRKGLVKSLGAGRAEATTLRPVTAETTENHPSTIPRVAGYLGVAVLGLLLSSWSAHFWVDVDWNQTRKWALATVFGSEKRNLAHATEGALPAKPLVHGTEDRSSTVVLYDDEVTEDRSSTVVLYDDEVPIPEAKFNLANEVLPLAPRPRQDQSIEDGTQRDPEKTNRNAEAAP